MKKILFLLLICPLLYFTQTRKEDILYVGTGVYTVPCGVTELTIEGWGAGGGGGRATTNGRTTAGGGGGAYAKKVITVTPGQMISYTVGAGGSGGTGTKNGGDTRFVNNTVLLAKGGKGASNNDVGSQATVGGLASESVGDITYSGGTGGYGSGTGAGEGSGGGGGAATRNSNGGNGFNGGEGFFLFGGTGGAGGNSATPGGAGGNGTGNSILEEARSGSNYGGGGGGAKKGVFGLLSPNENGGDGANGLLIITYVQPSGAVDPIQPPTEVSKVVSCQTEKVRMQALGGNVGAGASTLWVEGTVCPAFLITEEMMDAIPSSRIGLVNATVSEQSGGTRVFTATTGDPAIDMQNLFSSTINYNYKYLVVRYKVLTGSGGNFEVYLKKSNTALSESFVVRQNINSDKNWHIASIDLSINEGFSGASNANRVNGWRFDFTTVAGMQMEIDYILLSNTPIIDNNSADDSILEVETAHLTGPKQYRAVRIADQQLACNNTVQVTPCIPVIVNRVRKEFTNNDGVWSNNGNWLPNGIPNITEHCVVIPNGKKASVNIPNAESKGLTVENGGVLVVETGMTLKTQEQIINLGDGTNFTVENDGNLLQVDNVSNIGNITVKRNTSMKKNDYTYWGSPVEGQNLRAFSPGKLYTYNEWDDYFTLLNGTDNFDSKAKGYAIQAGPTHQSGVSTAFNGVFLGKPKNGNIVMTLKRQGRGYNLIGNPYPSNIDFTELYAANSDLIYNTAYFWTNLNHNPASQGSNYPNGRTINNYAILNGTGGVPATNSKQPTDSGYKASQIPNEFIKVGQGFIVRKKAAGDGDMIFNNAMRSNDNTGHFFRKKPRDRYWLELKTPLNIYTTLLVGYIENATNDFEIDYDATLMAVGSDAFYSVLGTRKLGIQGKASFVNTDVVALGTSHHENGEYTISAPTREGIFASSQSIYLKDKQTGITTDLTKGDYTFTANKGLSEGRFEIVYQPDATLDVVDPGVSSEEVQIYRDGDHFVAKSKTSRIMKIQLFNVSGQYLISVSPELNEYKWSHQLLNNGVYVVNIQLENGKIVSRKILK